MFAATAFGGSQASKSMLSFGQTNIDASVVIKSGFGKHLWSLEHGQLKEALRSCENS